MSRSEDWDKHEREMMNGHAKIELRGGHIHVIMPEDHKCRVCHLSYEEIIRRSMR